MNIANCQKLIYKGDDNPGDKRTISFFVIYGSSVPGLTIGLLRIALRLGSVCLLGSIRLLGSRILGTRLRCGLRIRLGIGLLRSLLCILPSRILRLYRLLRSLLYRLSLLNGLRSRLNGLRGLLNGLRGLLNRLGRLSFLLRLIRRIRKSC